MKKIMAILLASAVLVGCAEQGRQPSSNGWGNKQTIGTIGGAALGAWAGSNIGGGKGNVVAIAAGTLLGAWAGSEIGSSLDKADQMYMAQTTQSALESGRSGNVSTWQNPDSGVSGTVTPVNTYNTNGQYCRDYQQTVTMDGRTEQVTGTACRQADGSWRSI